MMDRVDHDSRATSAPSPVDSCASMGVLRRKPRSAARQALQADSDDEPSDEHLSPRWPGTPPPFVPPEFAPVAPERAGETSVAAPLPHTAVTAVDACEVATTDTSSAPVAEMCVLLTPVELQHWRVQLALSLIHI